MVVYRRGDCEKKLKENEYSVLCKGRCEEWYCLTCSNLTKQKLTQIGKNKEVWYCNNCQHQKSEVNRPCATKRNEEKDPIHGSKYTIDDVMQKLIELNDKYDKLYDRYFQQKEINTNLQKQVEYLEKRINTDEQENIKHNIIIHGVIPEGNGTSEQIFNKIMDAMNLKIETNEVQVMKLTSARDEKIVAPILVKCKNSEIKRKIMQRRREVRNLKINDADLRGQNNIIYINDQLTKFNQELLKKARELIKKGTKFVWTKEGKIFVRKREDTKIYRVECENDLQSYEDQENQEN